MTSEQARRYLLRQLTDDETVGVESEYFGSADALEIVDATYEHLIDEYLENTLSADDRQQFEAVYRESPKHWERVETVRRLKAAAHSSARSRGAGIRTLALAAAVLLAVAGIVWVVERARRAPPAPSAAQAAATAPVPHVFAMSISPVTVRGANESPALVIPLGTDVIGLRLEGEGAGPPVASGRVVIRTVAGKDQLETWQGPIQIGGVLPPGTIAHVDVPADRLVPDDYVVTLFETGPTGAEGERFRYFLRVRR